MHLKFTLLFMVIFTLSFPAVSQDLTVDAVSSLDFGDQIFPGITQTISRTDANRAMFAISGEAEREVQIIFHLPSYLNDNFSNNLSVTFDSDAAGYHINETGQSVASAFDPKESLITTLSATGKLYIWLGGILHPDASQPGNTYSGGITLDVSYTTN